MRQTPQDFLFAVKASRYLTHVRRLREIDEGIKRFYDPLEPMVAAGRLGPVLWQLPENFHRDDTRLEGWLRVLPEGMHTIEFRHPSWFVPEVMDALRERGVALTIGDHPKRPFQSLEATAPWVPTNVRSSRSSIVVRSTRRTASSVSVVSAITVLPWPPRSK